MGQHVALYLQVDLPFCAIKLLPLAGRPTITTHIRVSSTCTPTPLALFLELALVRVVGNMKSLGGVRAVFSFGAASTVDTLVSTVVPVCSCTSTIGGGIVSDMMGFYASCATDYLKICVVYIDLLER